MRTAHASSHVFLVFSLPVVVGCGSEASRDLVRVEILDGVEYVTNSGDGLWQPEERWTVAAARVRIGRADGDGPDVFGSISGLAVSGDGRIHVGDTRAREVRVFSDDGQFLFRFGRQGQGPGEFLGVDGIAILPDGRIAVRDPLQSRALIFDQEGAFVSLFQLQRPYMLVSNGTGWWSTSDSQIIDRSPGIASIGVGVYTPDGVLLSEAHLLEVPDGGGVRITRNGLQVASLRLRFEPRPLMATSPDGRIAVSDGKAYNIKVTTRDGAVLRHVIRERNPDVISDRERALATADLIAQVQEMFPDGQMGSFERPTHKPAYTDLFGDADGNLWAGRRGGERFDGLPSEYDVYDSDGRFLGSVQTPPIRVLQIGADFVAGVARDELGVESVVIHPIVKVGG